MDITPAHIEKAKAAAPEGMILLFMGRGYDVCKVPQADDMEKVKAAGLEADYNQFPKAELSDRLGKLLKAGLRVAVVEYVYIDPFPLADLPKNIEAILGKLEPVSAKLPKARPDYAGHGPAPRKRFPRPR